MPIEIYTAPAASGKTTFAIELAKSATRPPDSQTIQPVQVVVASSSQARMWQQRLAQVGGAIGIEVMIFDRMVAAILAEAGEAWTQLSEPVEYRLIRSILDQQELVHFDKLRHRPGFVDVVQQLLPLLKSALIDPEDLRIALHSLDSEPRLKELSKIYTAYQTTLQENDWADRIGLHWLALEALEKQELNIDSKEHSIKNLLIIDGFDDFTPAELAIFKILGNRHNRMVVTLTQPAEVELPRYASTLNKLKQLGDCAVQPLPIPITPTPLNELANRLFGQNRSTDLAWVDRVTLIEATDRPTEIRAALRWLKQRMVQDGLQPADVALLARDVSAYRPFIQQVGHEFGLPIRIELGRLLNQAPIIDALLNLLKLHLPTSDGNAELARRQVVNVWRSPWFAWHQAGLKDLGRLADRLDNLGRAQRVIGGIEQWTAAFEAQIKTDETDDLRVDGELDEQQQSAKIVTGSDALALQNSFNRFLQQTAPPPTAHSYNEFVQWLEGLIGHDKVQQDKQNKLEEAGHSLAMVRQARAEQTAEAESIAALTCLKDVLRGLVWAENVVGQDKPVDFATFFTELSGAVNSAVFDFPIAKEPKPIVATNVNSSRGRGWRAIAIVGLSEGEFPAPIGEDPFLRDEDRQRLRTQFGFQLDPSTQSRERELFYEAVSRGSDRLLLTRPIIADNGAEWVPSPYWTEVQKLTGVQVKQITADARLRPSEAASQNEWYESLAPIAPDRLPENIVQGQHILNQRMAPAGHRGASEHDGDLSSVSAALADQFGPDKIWSPSRLEDALKCGMMFYVKNVLKVEPRPEPAEGMDVAQTGTLYHDIFEQAYTAGVPDTADRDEMQAFVSKMAGPVLAAAPEKQGFRETAWWSQTKADIIENVTTSILKLADDNWRFLQAEAAFGMHGNAPLVLQKDNGSESDQLRLRGYIDRVDQNAAGELRIIDYKLGGKAGFSKAKFEKGEKLQLPLYALAVEHALNLGAVTDGFYWHFKKSEPSQFQLAKYGDGPEDAAEVATNYAWQAVEQARAGKFEPTPPDGGCPSWCPAAAWCWRYQPSRY